MSDNTAVLAEDMERLVREYVLHTKQMNLHFEDFVNCSNSNNFARLESKRSMFLTAHQRRVKVLADLRPVLTEFELSPDVAHIKVWNAAREIRLHRGDEFVMDCINLMNREIARLKDRNYLLESVTEAHTEGVLRLREFERSLPSG